jgi:hypothetical protein
MTLKFPGIDLSDVALQARRELDQLQLRLDVLDQALAGGLTQEQSSRLKRSRDEMKRFMDLTERKITS